MQTKFIHVTFSIFLLHPLPSIGEGKNIKNLHNFVSAFPSCLVHIVNYEGVNLNGISSPIVLSRYIPLRPPKRFIHPTDYNPWMDVGDYPLYPYEYKYHTHFAQWNKGYPFRTDFYVGPKYKKERTFRARWYCMATFYLLPPEPKCEIVENGTILVEKSGDLSIQYYWTRDTQTRISCQGMEPGKRKFALRHPFAWITFWKGSGEDPYPSGNYRILVRSSSTYRWQHWLSDQPSMLWSPAFRSTAHVLTYDETLEEIIPQSLSHVCVFCNQKKVVALPWSRLHPSNWNTNKLRSILEQGITYMAKHTTVANWKLGILVNPYAKKERLNQILAQGYKYSFIDLDHKTEGGHDRDLLEITLFSIAIASSQANYSASLPEFRKSWPFNEIDKKDPNYWRYPTWDGMGESGVLAAYPKQRYGFVTCGGRPVGVISFTGYISAFDLETWISFILVYVVLGLFLSLIAKYYNNGQDGGEANEVVVGDWKEVRIFYMGVRVLLEQGDDVALNNKKIGFMYWVCSVWIMMAVVLSNAYKGNNISDIAAPKNLPQIGSFQELVDSETNFTIYTKHVLLKKNTMDEASCRKTHDYLNLFGHVHRYPIYSEFHKLVWNSMTKKWFPNSTRDFEYALFNRTLANRTKMYESCYKFANHSFSFFNVLQDCRANRALLGWEDELKSLSLQLEYAVKRRYKTPVSMVLHDSIYRNTGWSFRDYIGKGLVENIGRINGEAGLMAQWRNIFRFFGDGRKQRAIQSVPRVHPSLGIDSNIATVFVILLVGCAFACLSMVAEFVVQLGWKIGFKIGLKIKYLHRLFKVGTEIVNAELRMLSVQVA